MIVSQKPIIRFLKINIIVVVFFLSAQISIAQKSGIKPQYWNNLSVGYQINDRFWVGNTFSYNVLIDKDFPWSEIANNTVFSFAAKGYLILSGGLYIASTKQSKNLSSFELRPYTGVRFITKSDKRLVLSNLSRLELRNLDYSDNTNSSTFRLRNRTLLAIAINHQSLLEDNTLSLFSYFEVFHNFEREVIERYFTTLKYKVGVGYRFSPEWHVNLGALFNEARSTIAAPSQAPVNLITNVILEWGVNYRIKL